ncbi:phosphoribosylanthranilate isomerase [Rhodohalobacter sp.]|uniref:phosphoribosylanthranilate isomerase n=1 Tax=Rhodohalobacter sp. TaxID=1974210 RepID=UPI0035635A46
MFAEPENRTKVKICGLTTLEDARFVSGALADYLGFIFYPNSPRYIKPAKAGAIINWLEGPGKVGVFVNQPLDDVNSIAKQTGIDYLQLHGNESPDYCALVEKPVIKAFHIEKDTDPAELVSRIEPYLDQVDYLLFDTKSETEWGGTGQTFDWNILDEISSDKPFFLSGGLNSENVRDAIQTMQPYAVDLSSGLEDSPGLKDFDKIELFFEKMRDIWEEQEF